MGRLRIAAIVSHPIQYQAPLFRALSANTDIDLTVYFEHDHGVTLSLDREFGKTIQFDVPLTEGFASRFITIGRGFNRSPQMLIRGLAEMLRDFRSRKFDWVWVHGYTNPSTLTALAAARALRIPTLMRGESTLLYSLPRPKRVLKNISMRTLVSQCTAFGYIGNQNERFYLSYGATPQQLFFAPYSIDNARFARDAAQAMSCGRSHAIRSDLRLSESDCVSLFVGKLIPRKRPLDLVHALKHLPRNHAAVFLGDGPMRARVEQELSRQGVRGSVVGFVNQSSLAAYYAAADMLVLPSEQETWGLVANEAMACGKPVVASDLVGSSFDLIGKAAHGGSVSLTGQMYECGNIEDLSSAMSNVAASLGHNPDGVREAVLRRIAAYDISATAKGLFEAFSSRPHGRISAHQSSGSSPYVYSTRRQ